MAGARWPRVSAEATWLHRVANVLRDIADVERPIARLEALRGVRRLLDRAPATVRASPDEGEDPSCHQVLPPAVAWWSLLSNLRLASLDPAVLQKLQAGLHGDAIALAERDMAQRTVQFQQWVEKQAAGGGGGQ